MGTRKKIIFWSGGCVGAVLLLLLLLVLLAPKLINLNDVRERALATASEKVGGEVIFQSIDLSLLPIPHATIRQASLSIPGKVGGTLESLRVYPKIRPLLSGKLQIAELQIRNPNFKVILSGKSQEQGEKSGHTSSRDLEKNWASLLAPLALDVPDLVAEVENGRLDIFKEDQPLFSFRNMNTRIVFPPEGFRLKLTATSNFFEKIAVEATLDSRDFKGKGRVDLTHFQPHILSTQLFPQAPYVITDSQANLTFGFKFNGLKALKAELGGDLTRIAIQTRNEKLLVQGKSIKASFQMNPDRTAFTLSQLQLTYPQLSLAGNLLLGQDAPQIRLELEGRDVDVSSTREVALALAGDVSDVQEIFGIVRGGKFPLISFKAQGPSFADVTDLENIRIEASMVEGKILIPDVELDLEDAKGNVVITKGILEGKNLEARLGKSWGREAKLKLGLKEKDTQLHLDTLVEGELSQLPPILKRLIDNKSFLQEIELIEDLKGNAKGRLILGESTERVKVRVDAWGLNLSAKYKRIPYPLEISGGHFFYHETKIDVKDLSGKLGGSSFSQLSAGVALKNEPYLEVKSGKLDLLTDELYPWLISLEDSPVSPEDLKSVTGHIHYTALDLKGPLLSPDKWESKHSGELRNLVIESRLVPETLEIRRGNFEATVYPNKQELSFKDAQVRMQDASMTMSGVVYDYFEGLHNIDLLFRGDIGPQSNKWVAHFLNLPPMLALHAPLSLSDGRLFWEKNAKTSFKTNLAVQEGPSASIDIFVSPEETRVINLLIKDEVSQASMAFDLKERELSLRFTGNLEKRTLNNLFVKSDFIHGRIEGDFRAQILLDHPMKSSAQGRLMGQDLIFPYSLKIPLQIDKLHLVAEKRHVDVEQAVLVWGRRHMTFAGDVDFSTAALVFDIGLDTDGVNWTQIKEIMGNDRSEKNVKQSKGLYDLPIEGILRLRSDYFNYDRFTWSPFHADIRLDPDEIILEIIEAKLCGLSTPGSLKISPRDVSLDFQPVAKNQELQNAVPCLTEEKVRMTGKFDLQGKVQAHGKPERLVESLDGNVEVLTGKGRIYRHVPLEKLFAYLNVLGIIKGQLSEMKGEGFAFDSISTKANIQKGKLLIQESIVDGLTMDMAARGEIDLVGKKIDLTVLVAPMKTVDTILKKIPIIRTIAKKGLISVAVKVHGDLGDPKYSTLPASAVGEGLFGMMKRTIKLPFQIIDVKPTGGAENIPIEPNEPKE